MASPITSSDFENQTPGQALCDAFQEKLLNNSKMQQLLDYFFLDPSGILGASFVTDLLNFLAPIGSFKWSPKPFDASVTNPGNGAVWVEAAGQELLRSEYVRLFAFYGTSFNLPADVDPLKFRLPPSDGKFLMARDATHTFGVTGGEATHKLTVPEGAADEAHTHVIGRFASDSGGGQNDVYLVTGVPGDSEDLTVSGRKNNGDGSGTVADLDTLTGGHVVSLSVREKNSTPTVDDPDIDEFDGHNNLPPFFTGVLYVLAGYKVNGVMV